MENSSMTKLIVVLSIAGSFFILPSIINQCIMASMSLLNFYLKKGSPSKITNGLIDARFIAIFNTALESPLGQVSMIPILAWIAQSAPTLI